MNWQVITWLPLRLSTLNLFHEKEYRNPLSDYLLLIGQNWCIIRLVYRFYPLADKLALTPLNLSQATEQSFTLKKLDVLFHANWLIGTTLMMLIKFSISGRRRSEGWYACEFSCKNFLLL